MLLSILKRANSNGVKTAYVKGRKLEDHEAFQKEGKLIVFEHGYGSLYDTEPAKFEKQVSFSQEPRIYHLRHVNALVVEGYVVFMHLEEPVGGIYKLNQSKTNTLIDIQTAAASIFGLNDAKPFVFENGGKLTVDSNEEWEDFLCAMTASNYIDAEDTEILTTNSVSAF